MYFQTRCNNHILALHPGSINVTSAEKPADDDLHRFFPIILGEAASCRCLLGALGCCSLQGGSLLPRSHGDGHQSTAKLWEQPSLERLASNLCLNCLNLYEMLSLRLTKDM